MNPQTAILAVAHPDPYPYYAALRAGPPLFRDERLGLWVASSAAAVTEVLASPDCRVRPAAEQTPRAIAGTPAGEVFARLVRMNDGDRHLRPKQALQRALAGIDLGTASSLAGRAAARIRCRDARDWTGWAFDVPLYTVAGLLVFNEAEQARIAAWTRSFVASLSPLSSGSELAAASEAAAALRTCFESKLKTGGALPDNLLSAVLGQAEAAGWDDMDGLVANLVGLLSQTCEASAGWIGNSMVALLSRPDVLETVQQSPDMLEAFIDEVSRFDPAVQNTRRFTARKTRIAGCEVEEGATILVLLAAANRDPAANPSPDEFLIERSERRVFGFGHGPHLCPGQALARAIVAGALRQFLRMPIPPAGSVTWSYQASVNARIPVFQSSPENRT